MFTNLSLGNIWVVEDLRWVDILAGSQRCCFGEIPPILTRPGTQPERPIVYIEQSHCQSATRADMDAKKRPITGVDL